MGQREFLPWNSFQNYLVQERAYILVAVMFCNPLPLPDSFSSLEGLLHLLPSEGTFLSIEGRCGTGRINGLMKRDHKSGGTPMLSYLLQLLSVGWSMMAPPYHVHSRPGWSVLHSLSLMLRRASRYRKPPQLTGNGTHNGTCAERTCILTGGSWTPQTSVHTKNGQWQKSKASSGAWRRGF